MILFSRKWLADHLCQLCGVRSKVGGVVGIKRRRASRMISEELESASHKCESVARAQP